MPVVIRGEAIGCISTAGSAPTGFVADAIGVMEYECVATQSFCREYFPGGVNLHAILAAPAVLFNRKDSLHAMFLQRLLGFPVNGYAMHYFPSSVALLTAVGAGVGYGLVPTLQVRTFIDDGDLISLAPQNRVAVSLYWHHWKAGPPNARKISELIVRHARMALIQLSAESADKQDEGIRE